MMVSIAMPLYDKARCVGRAIASVLSQTHPHWQLLVVDDGSTDGGADIVAAFRDPRIVLLRQPNKGPGAARNRAIQAATGSLMAFLDADDEWLPHYLEAAVASFLHGPCGIVAVTQCYIEYPSGVSTEEKWRGRGIRNGVVKISPATPPTDAANLISYMHVDTTVARTEVVRRYGGFYDAPDCRYGEDAHLWTKLVLNEPILFALSPACIIHREESELSGRHVPRSIDACVAAPDALRAQCPQELRPLLDEVLALRAYRTAVVLAFWGRWRDASRIRRAFPSRGAHRIPYATLSRLAVSPLTVPLAAILRAYFRFRRAFPRSTSFRTQPSRRWPRSLHGILFP